MNNNIFISPPQLNTTRPIITGKQLDPNDKSSFQKVFEQKLAGQNEVKFSAHALKRLETRNINFSQEDLNLLSNAVDRVEAKGSRESLVLMNDLALIVSVKNRTVITALDGQSMKENVFTNIDSAVIANKPSKAGPRIRGSLKTTE